QIIAAQAVIIDELIIEPDRSAGRAEVMKNLHFDLGRFGQWSGSCGCDYGLLRGWFGHRLADGRPEHAEHPLWGLLNFRRCQAWYWRWFNRARKSISPRY